MDGHHLILGTLHDFITGEELVETHDERYRQKIARLLVSAKGFSKTEITPRHQLEIQVDSLRARVPIDFLIHPGSRIAMLVKYGPGSLVTRQRPALAASRLVADYQIPRVVVTNGEDAQTLDGYSGKMIASGLDNIPDKQMIRQISENRSDPAIDPRRAQMEARLLYVYEVDGACPCDTTVCRLNA